MSGPAQNVRLLLLLEPAALSRVLDRLSVLGIAPRALTFLRDADGNGKLHLELDPLPPHLSKSLIARLGQILAVVSVTRGDDTGRNDANDILRRE